MVIISDCLKKLRTENNLTQMQLAKAFGLRPSTISAYENGDRVPSYGILIKYAAYFRVTTDYILGNQVRKMIDVSDLSDEELESIKVLLEEYRNK